MKKRVFCLFLALCLLLTACGQRQPEDAADDERIPEEKEQTENEMQDEPLPLPEEENEEPEVSEEERKPQEDEKPEEKEEGTKPAKKPQPAAPKYEPLVTVTSENERIAGAASKGLSAGMEQVMLDMMDCYYQTLSDLAVRDCAPLFATKAEADWHKAIWYSMVQLRKASLIDLHLVSYNFKLRCTGVKWSGNEEVKITVTEDTVKRFAGTAHVPSEKLGMTHTFVLRRTGQDSWLIKEHDSNDTPYTKFSYDAARGCDKKLNTLLGYISARQATRGGAGAAVNKTWDHDYNRQAAYQYMYTYSVKRNGNWKAYDGNGGNCQNFGSQTLLAGGIPMDEEGTAKWYWHSHTDQNYSWINVGNFWNYANNNTGYGLVAKTNGNYYDGRVGDILIVGHSGKSHTTVISEVITSGGATVDYLICSNTANYRNFPVSAYYFTQHWLVRILGWNDVEPVDPEIPGGETPEGGAVLQCNYAPSAPAAAR